VPEVWQTYGPVAVALLTVAAGWAAAEVAHRVLRRVGRRLPVVARLGRRIYRPAQLLGIVLGTRIAVATMTGDGAAWRGPLLHILLIAAIGAGAWLVTKVLHVLEDTALNRFRLTGAESPEARRVRTQVVILRRVTAVIVAVLAIGLSLTTFEAVRGVGASVLASAGVLGVVAGLAAQSTLGNIFAGLQLAFGDRLRIGDVVVVEGEWGTVEEMTLGYVVVYIWDQRRLILPSSYFTTTPFVSWTRRDAEILGTVEMDVDWAVPVPEMRAELERFARDHPLWDGRVVNLQVTGATGSLVRVRPLVSAADGSDAWDLRCAVREHLVEWVRTRYPQALPRMRTEWAGGEWAGGAGTVAGGVPGGGVPPAIPVQQGPS
jgi:small-conductance mechanosensitive channel